MTGVILAGGRSSRFDNENKSFLRVKGSPIIDTQMRLFKKLFDEIIIVANDCIPYLSYDALIVSDIIKGKGPLGGIYTALYYMKNDSCFVAACDMPFLNEELIRFMMSNTGSDWIYTIKRTDRYEPLHSIYSKKCLKTVKKMVLNDALKISPLFDELRAKIMPVDDVKRIDPEMLSFKNINTESDLKEVS
jgi:molybdopterin-guanine dinucleotide biosynthesis protein A